MIGNSKYQHVAQLSNPANDAALVAETLKAAGFDTVDLRRDLKIADMRRALRDFADGARDADIAIVYYAGHGIEVGGINYVVPIDAALERDTDVLDEAISLDRILAAIEPAKRLQLVVLDACRNNPFAETMKRTIASRSIGRGLAKFEPESPNTLIAFAARAGSTAEDGDGKNSPFTTALAKEIARPGLDIRRAFGYVRDDVLKATGNRQEPFVYGSLGGDDLALVPVQTGTSGSPIDPDAAVRRDYELTSRLGSRDGWEVFLSRYSDGFYANLARAQLRKIIAADTARGESELASTQQGAVAKQQQVTSLSAPGDTSEQQKTGVDLPKTLQAELRRVGCFTGEVDGNWSETSRRALDLFDKYAGSQLDVRIASAGALDVVKSKTGRVCPLICERGYRPHGDTCAKIERVPRDANHEQRSPVSAEPKADLTGHGDLRGAAAVARAGAAWSAGTYKMCMGPGPRCYENAIRHMSPEAARTWCSRRPTC